MDVKVITRHAVPNYGSLLQAIATQTIMEQLGYSCEIIDYYRDEERGLRGVLTWLRGKKGWSDNPIRKLAYIAFRYPEEKAAELKFGAMCRRHLKLTPHCRNEEELSRLDADIFMTGSDQVWGLTLNDRYDEAYFLTFVRNKRKIAYAASFGRTDFSDKTIEDYKRFLSDYDGISVREDSAVRLLENWGIGCAGQMLDPTLMLTLDLWDKYVTEPIDKKYVLVYQIHNHPRLNYYAEQFAKHVGLPLVRVSPYLHQIMRGGKLCWLPDVGKFLSYIKHCSYLITDSFHGTAFALTYNKQFINVLEDESAGVRVQNILRITRLEDRTVSNVDDFSLCGKQIDYRAVNLILDNERNRSLKILKSIIEKL